MKILHLSMHENTGAGRAAIRLHQGLLQQHVESSFFVSERTGKAPAVRKHRKNLNLYRNLQPRLVNKWLDSKTNANTVFSINATPDCVGARLAKHKSDIVHLHWIGWEFLKLESLRRFKQPIVLSLHDMWPFTGGCHYAEDCAGYTQSCGNCPQLLNSKEKDLSRWVWQRKAKAWRDLNITLVGASQWVVDCARSSSLFRDSPIKVIAYGLDVDVFKPLSRPIARERLNLPQDKRIILFGAIRATGDRRKGFHLLQSALQQLSKRPDMHDVEIVIFGSSAPEEPIDVGFKCHYVGILNDDISLAVAYASADVMVVPSLQETFGQTALEALACGTPVVAFRATGLKAVVSHQQDGYLAEPYDVDELARGIVWTLERSEQLSQSARVSASKSFSLETQAHSYIELYRSLI